MWHLHSLRQLRPTLHTGLTEQGLGKRLKKHLEDEHAGCWDRFTWFGFRQVLKGTDECGICYLKDLAEITASNSSTAIRDVEALLIRAMGLSNIAQTKFSVAEEWFQVKLDELDHYLEKVACK